MSELYVNGDSWSWTMDLHDPGLWPNLVAQDVGMEIRNQAMGCGSNSRMVDSIYNHIAQGHRPELAIFMLTGHHRTHVPAPNMGAWSVGPSVALNDRTGESDEHLRNWIYSKSYDLVDSIYRYYRDIWKIHAICMRYSIPVWFFQAWDSDPVKYNALKDPELLLKNCDDSYNRDVYTKAFEFLQQESRRWCYVETPLADLLQSNDLDHTGHPNHSGHATIAKTVLEYIKGTKSI